MDFLESIPIKNPELFKNAMDVATEFNPYDPEEFQIAIAELGNLRENIEDPTRNEINLDNWIRWKSMIGFAKSFYSLMRAGLVEIGEPIGDTGGYVEFQVETSSYLRLFMSGEVKDRFLDLVRSCKVAEFEAVNNDNGPITYGNITFYS